MQFGPPQATLTVRTGTAGVAAKAGHNLEIEVGSWSATLEPGESLSVTVDPRSLRVLSGHGGPKPLTDQDMERIEATIREKVLRDLPIVFRSTRIDQRPGGFQACGELELAGQTASLEFTTVMADGTIRGSAVIRQSEWGITPHSAMMGTLKVADDVVVEADGMLPV